MKERMEKKGCSIEGQMVQIDAIKAGIEMIQERLA
jgi:hypothetical protein